jgi:quinol monooxygenase YgiN
MSTHVVNEFHAKPGRGDEVLALLLRLSPESRGRPGCEAISIRRNQDDPDNVIGDTRWATRQHSLAWRTQNGYTARFDQMLSEPMLIRYFHEIPFAPEPGPRVQNYRLHPPA